jgi:hypothetical protein
VILTSIFKDAYENHIHALLILLKMFL